MLLGTVVNTFAIIAGSLIGLFFGRFIPKAHADTVLKAVGLAVILIGLKMAWKTSDFIMVICSLAVGSGLGGVIGIEDRMNRMGKRLEDRFSSSGNGFSKAFVTTSLLYCVGSLAIVGSLESGLTGSHQTLFAKSVLDGLGSILFAATMGIGVLFSSLAVFLYQGTIAVSAAFAKDLLTADVIARMSAVGGLLIAGMGFNMLGMTKLKIGDMLPAIFIPLLYDMAQELVQLVR
ncbi:MAG: DUF554 domain-containing protein [Thermodesulfobacteriota bacterium]